MEKYIENLKRVGEDGTDMAKYLQGILETYNMDGILEVLEKVNHE